jgi:hypothetical protein
MPYTEPVGDIIFRFWWKGESVEASSFQVAKYLLDISLKSDMAANRMRVPRRHALLVGSVLRQEQECLSVDTMRQVRGP